MQNGSAEVNKFPSDFAQHKVTEFGSVVTRTQLVCYMAMLRVQMEPSKQIHCRALSALCFVKSVPVAITCHYQ